MRVRRVIALTLLLAAASCGSSSSTVGPLTITPPDGWLVTDREPGTIKVTNGTIGSDTSTKPGTATAVFDVYVDQSQTVEEFRDVLEENNVEPKIERMKVGGYDAVLVAYRSSHFGPSSEVVFVPEWKVRIVYRAAYGDSESSFARYREDFRTGLRSIRFSGRPPSRA
jgi:hypothetical protein